jgi:pSer/pThr/pTyr-binding forkhead associated (FHA) protein
VRKTTAAPTPALDAVAIDLTDLTPSPAPSPPPPSVISSSRKHTRSKAPPRASSVVLTVRRCAAWPAYEGLQVSIPLPATAASPTRQRRSARKKSSEAVTVTIGALEECQHVFENDEFLSGRHAQVKVERLEEGREGGGEENSVAIRIKDLNSTNGTRRNGEDLQANR